MARRGASGAGGVEGWGRERGWVVLGKEAWGRNVWLEALLAGSVSVYSKECEEAYEKVLMSMERLIE